MMRKDHLALYLKNYAEAAALTISEVLPANLAFQHSLVIPAYNESEEFLQRLKNSKLKQAPLLVIVIINQPDNISAAIENQKLWLACRATGAVLETKKTEPHHQLIKWEDSQTYLLALNCFEGDKRLPSKQGVGLARKIGCDLACALYQKGILTQPWLHTSDADTTLPEDYFSHGMFNKHNNTASNKVSAATYPFAHSHTDNAQQKSAVVEATLVYEQVLNYYIDGLKYAGSPYAYHSLGSCLAINIESYVQARGFPKRAGGEDFYLLNKLRKLGEIKQLAGPTLNIESRLSARAPFGTGPAVEKIIHQKLTIDNYAYYNPKVFQQLKLLLLHFEQLFANRSTPEKWQNHFTKEVKEALHFIGIESLFAHIQGHCKKQEDALKHSMDWFDAFRTLKFIHYLDKKYDKLVLKKAIDTLADMRELI